MYLCVLTTLKKYVSEMVNKMEGMQGKREELLVDELQQKEKEHWRKMVME